MNKSDIRWSVPQEELEHSAVEQAYAVAASYPVEALAIMPDCHTGYTMPIGGVALVHEDYICPEFVGYDIGCGMFNMIVRGLDATEWDQALNRQIHEELIAAIPTNKNDGRDDGTPTRLIKVMPISLEMGNVPDKTLDKFRTQFGTLGGGNHFVEIGHCQDGSLAITIHSGSRGFGHGLAEHYMKLAKTKGANFGGIHYLMGENRDNYFMDAFFAQAWALENRRKMADIALDVVMRHFDIDTSMIEVTNENHNTVEWVNDHGVCGWLHRKGATPANRGVRGVIPINQRDGIYITEGLGNSEFLHSASHGAGRVMSRGKAKKNISLDTFRDQMVGIASQVDEAHLDEAPDAYKKADYVIGAQEGKLIKVVDKITPLVVMKG